MTKANIFGLITIVGIIIIGIGVALSPIWFKCLFFGSGATLIGGLCLSTFCTEEEIIEKKQHNNKR